jgi:uncharacterized protein (UPF0147 family)
MTKATVTLDMKHTEIFMDMTNLVRDITNDERIPAAVREEIMDKVNLIIESRQDG